MVAVETAMTETEMLKVLHVILEMMYFNTKNIFSNSIEHVFFFSKFLSQKLNPQQLKYFTDFQMQMIF